MPKKGIKKEQTKQHPPKGATEGTGAGQVHSLLGFGFLFALRPFHNGCILNFNQLLFLQAFQLAQRLTGAGGGIKLPNG